MLSYGIGFPLPSQRVRFLYRSAFFPVHFAPHVAACCLVSFCTASGFGVFHTLNTSLDRLLAVPALCALGHVVHLSRFVAGCSARLLPSAYVRRHCHARPFLLALHLIGRLFLATLMSLLNLRRLQHTCRRVTKTWP